MRPSVLHAHSEFSTRDSLIRVDELPRLAAERGWSTCAITDHGGVEGVPAFMAAAKKVGIKPVAGCELYVACDDVDYNARKKESGAEHADRRLGHHHLTVLAKNAEGFAAICRLLTLAHAEPLKRIIKKDGQEDWITHYDRRRRHAAVPFDWILSQLGNCIILSGCASSPFWRDTPGAERDLARAVAAFQDDFFFEVQGLPDWSDCTELNKRIVAMAEKYKRPMVVTPDCHYANKDDYEFHEGLLAVSSAFHVGHKLAWRFSSKCCWLMRPEELARNLAWAGLGEDRARAALEMTGLIAERIESWDWSQLPEPELPHNPGDLYQLAQSGLVKRMGTVPPEYQVRLDEELRVFQGAKLDQYFLLIIKVLDLLKEHGAVIGPRGSVGGSLVAYALGIATLDPIKHGLGYQRFYAPGRSGWPDCDIDLQTPLRDHVPQILRRKFGAKCVAQISNYMEFGIRSSVKDAARAFGVYPEFDEFAETPVVEGDDLRKLSPEALAETMKSYSQWQVLHKCHPKAAELAVRMAGRVRQFGSHAGGFVITRKPVAECRGALVMRGSEPGLPWDMEWSEKLGFVKMDFLGNDSMTAMAELNRVMAGRSDAIDWDNVPLNDPDIMSDFAKGRTCGLPQFLTSGLRAFTQSLASKLEENGKSLSFKDLVWANAAFRPGTIRRFSAEYLIDRYCKDPDNLITFQEDVLEIFVGLAGYSWREADAIRKIIGKRLGVEEFKKHEEKFVQGCAKMGTLSEQEARQCLSEVARFAEYGFNLSHATSYARNAAVLAWAKRNHPLETFCALLNAVHKAKEEEKRARFDELLDEAKTFFDVKVKPAHVNFSAIEEWTSDGTAIRKPLRMMPHVNLRIARLIEAKRREVGGSFRDATHLREVLSRNTVPLELFKVAFAEEEGSTLNAFAAKPGSFGLNLDEWRQKIRNCIDCEHRQDPLSKCREPVATVFGRTNVFIVGEAPGKDENRLGKPFIGQSGDLLEKELKRVGIERKNLCWTNTLKCFPVFQEIVDARGQKQRVYKYPNDTCWSLWGEREMQAFSPPLVLAVGKHAWYKLGGNPRVGIQKANASEIGYGPGDATRVVACIHPASVLRDPTKLSELRRAIRKFAELFHSLSSLDGPPIIELVQELKTLLPPIDQPRDWVRQRLAAWNRRITEGMKPERERQALWDVHCRYSDREAARQKKLNAGQNGWHGYYCVGSRLGRGEKAQAAARCIPGACVKKVPGRFGRFGDGADENLVLVQIAWPTPSGYQLDQAYYASREDFERNLAAHSLVSLPFEPEVSFATHQKKF